MSTPAVTPSQPSASAPPPQTLAQRIRAKFPGSYDDMDDYTLEQKVLAKYPQYGDLPQTPKPQAQQQPTASISSAQTGVLPWLKNLESDVRYGSNMTGPGRFLHAIGMQPTSAGVNPATEDQMASTVLGPIKTAQGVATLPSHPWQGTKQIAGGLLQSASLPLSFAGPGAAEEAPQVIKAAGEGLSGAADTSGNALARLLRNPATARQSQLGKPGTAKNFLPGILQRYVIPDALIPKGQLGTVTNPGPFAEIPVRVPVQRPPGLGSIAERDATNLNKVPFAGEEAEEPTSIIERDATRQNTPYAGEEEISPEEAAAQAKQSAMPRPLRPTVGTPEEFQAYDNQMARLKQEASDAGTYSAARGKVNKKLNYQQRIGKNF